MEEEKKEDVSVEEVKEESKKSSIIGSKKEVKGKKLKVWLIIMILIFMLFTFGLGVFLGGELCTKDNKKKANNQQPVEQKNLLNKE